jgi:hypothetical protein
LVFVQDVERLPFLDVAWVAEILEHINTKTAQYFILQEQRIRLRIFSRALAMRELLNSAEVACYYHPPDRRPNLDPNAHATDTDTDVTDSDSWSDTDADLHDDVSEPECTTAAKAKAKQQLLRLWCTTAAKAKAKTSREYMAQRLRLRLGERL